jgi:metal-responsive CopG/Arc/MetJ family transcriptional regulator
MANRKKSLSSRLINILVSLKPSQLDKLETLSDKYPDISRSEFVRRALDSFFTDQIG